MRPRPPPSRVAVVALRIAAAAALQVLARDFLERQEAVALGAVIDEARFEAGLDAGDDGFVDVALALLLACGLDVEVDQFLAVDDGHPKLLRLGGVEQHAFHSFFPAPIRPGVRRGETEAARLARRNAIERRTPAKPTVPGAMAAGRREGARQSIVPAGRPLMGGRRSAISWSGWASCLRSSG